MGPQPNSCGNARDTRSFRPSSSLQWGHSQTAVETAARSRTWLARIRRFNGATAKQLWKHDSASEVTTVADGLQWGHSQTAVETSWNWRKHIGSWSLQWGHSQTAVETRRFLRYSFHGLDCFNGATAKQLWKQADAKSGCGRLSSASMGPQPNSCGNRPTCGCSRPVRASMGPQPNSCGNGSTHLRRLRHRFRFNGATAKQLWKPVSLALALRRADRASMGPQPNSCGNHSTSGWDWQLGSSFNGATAKQLWKHVRSPFKNPCSKSFNGATAKQLWKRESPRSARPTPSSFNGATAKQLWKHAAPTFVTILLFLASMGPQPNSCGNTPASSAPSTYFLLQWGHSQTAVETSFRFYRFI